MNPNIGTLLISCPDQPGIVAAVSKFLYDWKGNILESNQYTTDAKNGIFFMRIQFYCQDLKECHKNLEHSFNDVSNQFQMNASFTYGFKKKRIAIFVSKQLHCLQELLWEWQQGDLDGDIVGVISNHVDSQEYVESLGIPFYHFPITKENKLAIELEQIKLIQQLEADVLVLARYMQILSPAMVKSFQHRIINIHHSFLPAFIGANPYEKAFQRGVKLIGATSHYVTDDLDEGPIIEQDICRVHHHQNVDDLKKQGSKIERIVLLRAVKWHLEDRILIHENKTIVFA